jgi:pimeloyl-ACP methyl ester carboxylesterase
VSKRNILRIVAAAAFVAWLAWSQLRPHAHGTAPERTLLPAVAANAREFRIGSLQFSRCELGQKRSGATTDAFCAPFQVPENYADPGGRKVDLKLAIVKADAEAADADFVVYLAGGPGQSAVETWPQVAGALAPLRKHHHIVLLDQRGTGGSNALTCERKAKAETPGAAPARLVDDLETVRRQTRDCLAEVQAHADPRFYTTTVATRDLESVRQALGAPQFDLVGISYGTRMAQQYLMHYPDAVRSVVLDSVAPNSLVFGEEFAENLENALKAQFALCAKSPPCAKAFPDPYASLIKLRDELRAQPRDYDFRDPVTFEPTHRHLDDYTVAGLVRIFAYTPETAALLPLSIAEALKGNYTPLAGQSQLLTADLADLRDNGMQTSVVCAEDADLLSPRPQDADLVLGSTLIQIIQAQCEIWPKGTRPADFHEPLKTAKPVFVLEGELDPVTPPKYGEEVMRHLSNARLLIAKGQGHNVIGRGCIPKLVEDFVDTLAPKDLDLGCADALGPTPPFVDFNGAAP